jgi:hypothetical protein
MTTLTQELINYLNHEKEYSLAERKVILKQYRARLKKEVDMSELLELLT